MTTSTQADAPHGMEFLYSLNRLNVAGIKSQMYQHFGWLTCIV